MKRRMGCFCAMVALAMLLPAAEGRAQDYYRSFPGKCIGGSRCGGFGNTLVIRLGGPVHVHRIEFYADDDVGRKSDAKVDVYGDGRIIRRNINIKKRGRSHEISVNRVLHEIAFRPARNDEANIREVRVYGSGGRHGPPPPYDDHRRDPDRYRPSPGPPSPGPSPLPPPSPGRGGSSSSGSSSGLPPLPPPGR